VDGCPIAEAEALARVGGDKELLAELLPMLAEALDQTIPEIERALGGGDAETSRSLCHRLKGSSANLSAHRLRQVAAEMEQKAKASDLDAVNAMLPALKAESERFKNYLASYRVA